MPKIFILSRNVNIAFLMIILFVIIAFFGFGCSPKAACGSKHDHKVHAKNTKRMAPSMSK